MRKLHRSAILAGALGHGNVGDEMLAQAFVRRHSHHFIATVHLTQTPEGVGDLATQPPTYAIGRRFWRGWISRWSIRRWVGDAVGGTACDYVWVGGLFGEPQHVLARARELQWASSFARRLIYYFGDAEEKIRYGRYTARLVSQINRRPAWIGVRSHEAAEVLRAVGVEHPIHVGVDPVLFDRVEAGVVRRVRNASVALCPAGVPGGSAVADWWLRAARSAARWAGEIEWLAFEANVDEPVCRQLAAQLADELPSCRQRVVTGEEVLSQIESCRACVSGRYHALIYAVTAGVPTVVLGWNDKLRRLGTLMAGSEWVVEPEAHQSRIEACLSPDRLGSWTIDSNALQAALDDHREALRCLELYLT